MAEPRWRRFLRAARHELFKVLALGGAAWSCGDTRSVLAAFGEPCERWGEESGDASRRRVDVRREAADGIAAIERFLAAHDRPPRL